jgi:hypothetical protein
VSLETARQIADAILYEGYILYPYRASHGKNQSKVRWQFGVLVPQAFAGANPLPPGSETVASTISGAGETWFARTECIVDPAPGATIEVRLRFLHIQSRIVEELRADGSFVPVESLEGEGGLVVTWDEGVEQEIDTVIELEALCAGEQLVPVQLEASEEMEALKTAGGHEIGRIIRRRQAIALNLRASAESLPGPYGIARLRLVTENVTDWTGAGAGREESLVRSPVATHLIIALGAGSSFVSLLDPPQWAKPAVDGCVNQHIWPVLVGQGRPDTVLSSPMVLPDYPEIAPESPMDLFDGTENDELLSLRIMTLTDDEKAQARATDSRAAAILDSVDNMPPAVYERLHGAIRSFREATGPGAGGVPQGIVSDDFEFPEIWTDEKTGEVREGSPIKSKPAPIFDAEVDASYSPETDSVPVAGVMVCKGSRVVLRPGLVRSDAQDMFLEGRTARIQAVLFDAEDQPYLAVVLDDDPAGDIHMAHGRFLYFKPYEVEPLEGALS